MLMSLDHPKRVALHILPSHKPRRMLTRATLRAFFLDAADTQALPLAERVEAQALVLSNAATAFVLDRSRLLGDVPVEELPKRPLADEADAGRILLLRVGQSDLVGDAPHFGLAQFAHREER